MRTISLLLLLAVAACAALAQRDCEDGSCIAERVPSGPGAFTVATNYMSDVGFMRWQHYTETKVWLTAQEVSNLLARKQR